MFTFLPRMLRVAFLHATAILLGIAVAQTPAGTLIVAQAVGSYASGRVVPSNQVVTVVQTVCAVRITPSGAEGDPAQAVAVVQDGTIYLPFTIVNVGNDRFTFDVGYALGERSWVPERIDIRLDENRDGLPDAGAALTSLPLDAGEAAALLLDIRAPEGTPGDLLLTPTAACADPGLEADAATRTYLANQAQALTPAALGEQAYARIYLAGDDDPVGQVRVKATLLPRIQPLDPPQLQLNVDVTNVGADARNARVTIAPTTPGTLTIDTASLETTGARRAQAPASAANVVLDVGALPAGESAGAALRATVQEHALEDGFVQLTVRADLDGIVTQQTIPVQVPSGRDFELTHASDARARDAVRLGTWEEACFPVTLRNVGAEDAYRIVTRSTLDPDASTKVDLSLRSEEGLPLVSPLPLASGSQRTVTLCLRARAAVPPFTARIDVVSLESANAKSVSVDVLAVALQDELIVELSAEPTGTVAAGDTLHFTVTHRNDGEEAIEAVVAGLRVLRVRAPNDTPVEAPLQWLEGPADATWDPTTMRATWSLGTLEPGEAVTQQVQLVVGDDVPDDTILQTVATAATELDPTERLSSIVQHDTWSGGFEGSIVVHPALAVAGDRLALRVTVRNTATQPITVSIVDLVAPGVTLEPTEAAQAHTVDARSERGFDIPARLVAVQRGALHGALRLAATSAGGADAGQITLPFAVTVDPGPFVRDVGVLTGHVYLSAAGPSVPSGRVGLEGVRIVLPDGRQVYTGSDGEFTFPGVPVGWTRVHVDAASLPAPLADAPTRVAGSAHRVFVHALTVLDVPVEALAVLATLETTTRMETGPIVVTQTTRDLPSGDRVRSVAVRSAVPVADLRLVWLDADRERIWDVGTLEGTSRTEFILPAGSPAVEPTIEWRVP